MKERLKLAYKTGALSIIHNQMLPLLDEETQRKMADALDKEFEVWYEAMTPVFQMVDNAV